MFVHLMPQSQVEEEQAVESLLLKPKWCVLPEVGLDVRWMLAQAASAEWTDFRRLSMSVFTPRGRE
jgi:hypothetical protein